MTNLTTNQQNALSHLTQLGLNADSTILATIRTVAASGMSRTASFFIIENNQLVNITYYLAELAKVKTTVKNGMLSIKCGGCGMDALFAFIYNLPQNEVINFENLAQKYRQI